MKKADFLLLVLTFLVIATPAMAYIDPGSGSMILQVILAGILGGLFAIKVFWQRVKAFFKALFGKKTDSPKNDR